MEEDSFKLCQSSDNGLTYKLDVRFAKTNSWHISSFSPDHVSHLFTKIAASSVMNLKSLRLGKIPHIPPELLSQAVTKLEGFKALSGGLTATQISAVMTELSAVKDHKLKYLDLACNNLSSVLTDTLVAGISGLEEVDLSGTDLTTEQLTGIYRMVADRRCSSLRKIYLWGNRELYKSSVTLQDLSYRAKLNQSVEIID